MPGSESSPGGIAGPAGAFDRAREPSRPRRAALRAPGGLIVQDAEYVVGATSGVRREADERPTAVSFAAPRPNPTAGNTRLESALPAAGVVRLAVFDVHGREATRLADGVLEPGRHVATWDRRDDTGRALPAGLDFAKFEVGGATMMGKVTRAR